MRGIGSTADEGGWTQRRLQETGAHAPVLADVERCGEHGLTKLELDVLGVTIPLESFGRVVVEAEPARHVVSRDVRTIGCGDELALAVAGTKAWRPG